jgi:hypothetical protein
MRFRTIGAAIAAATTLVAAAGGVALADDIANQLDTSIDATAEIMSLNVGGAPKSTTMVVSPTNDDDGKNGCNLTGQTVLQVSVVSDAPTVATVSPSSLTFASCGDVKTVTVTPLTAGDATISLQETFNDSQGTFNLAPATFFARVTGSSNSAPSVDVTGVSPGASYAKGAVPAATCVVADAEDGPSSFPATLSAVTGPYASDGIGSQTASCSYTDAGGLTASGSATYSIEDVSAPVITYTLNPTAPDGLAGWYRSDVTLTWNVSEDESPGSLVKTGCVDQTIASDQVATTYACSATSAGGSTGPVVTDGIKRDATAPTVTYGSASGTAGANGWYVSPVTATFDVSDATSGVDASQLTASSVGEGSAVVVDSPTVTDHAGNTTPTGAASGTFKIDLTDPTATFDSTFDTAYYYGQVPAQPTCTVADAVSGPDTCVVTGYSTAVGPHTLVATGADKAGRTSTATMPYEVKAWTLKGFYQPVDMGTIVNTVKAGSTVPLKFEVFAGNTELTSTSTVKSFSVKGVACNSGTADDVELVTTGGTSLRYDATAGQFIQNWQTPKTAGACYQVTMTTQDGSSLSALFKLK